MAKKVVQKKLKSFKNPTNPTCSTCKWLYKGEDLASSLCECRIDPSPVRKRSTDSCSWHEPR